MVEDFKKDSITKKIGNIRIRKLIKLRFYHRTKSGHKISKMKNTCDPLLSGASFNIRKKSTSISRIFDRILFWNIELVFNKKSADKSQSKKSKRWSLHDLVISFANFIERSKKNLCIYLLAVLKNIISLTRLYQIDYQISKAYQSLMRY